MRLTLSDQAIRRIADQKRAVVDDAIFERVDFLIEIMGEKELIDNIFKGMSIDEAEETLLYIERMYDVESIKAEMESDF